MKKLFLSLGVCGLLFGAVSAHDEHTRRQKGIIDSMATAMTAIDLATRFTILPVVYKCVNKQMFAATKWPWYSAGAGLGAGIVAVTACSELLKLLVTVNASEGLSDAAYKKNKEQRSEIYGWALLAAMIGFFVS